MPLSRTIQALFVHLLALLSAALLIACSPTEQSPGAGIRGVSFVGIAVADLEQSAEFYSAGADLIEVESYKSASVLPLVSLIDGYSNGIHSRLLRSSNAQLRLMQFDPSQEAVLKPVPVQGPGITHICFQVNKKTGSYERFLELGAEHIGAREMVQLSSRNPVEYAYVKDLDGAIMEIEHVDVAALDLPEPPANDYRIRHVSFGTPDINILTNFYSRLLGGQAPREVGHWFGLSGEKLDRVSGLADAKIRMSWLQTRNLELEFIQYLSHPTAVPSQPRPLYAIGYNMIVFDVESLDQAREALLAAGGTLVAESLAMDGGEVLFGRDPDGNFIGFQRVVDDAPVSSQNFENNGL